ncbi:restriction endonuclease subunit S [Aulosira sp. FACHB-615]|uniref:restriction endonuclease subunit S n=1 Tax=Aulosira sp. FACHB-615 TaxID=2692777 RepID=UPI001689F23C|nr:restriction endonuclease subunit S [Aulosira sp. FACHB-615]MBD2491980.1 restriction endonuclease subunit S [Aulosira sp. FACHB-615]
MKIETFFEKFELFAEAPNGVQKMRELILQLAVQGKLVPQDSSDEPASVLLEKIQFNKELLIKEKKIKRNKQILHENLEKKLTKLPEGWEWTRLVDVGLINPRNEVEDNITASFIPMNLIPQFYGESIKYEIKEWGDIKQGFTHFADEDAVLAKITPCFQNRKSAVMRGLENGVGAGTTELYVFRPLNGLVYSEYVLIYLKSPDFINSGISKLTGTAGQKRVPNDYFSQHPFPLPPLAEQHRIVAKVDQLMSLCDELEERQQKKRETRVLLNNVAINQLLTAREPDTFAKHWQCICNNFDLLYSAPENIGKLRQAILQLAVMGKLVPQDSSDEPAAVLLDKIRFEKELLMKEGKIKKEKLLPEITVDELEYKIPQTWVWSRLGEICELITDGTHQTPKYTPSGRIFISAQNVKPFRFMPEVHKFVSEEDYQGYIKNRKPEVEDVLLTRVGAGIGEAAVIDKNLDFAIYVSVALIRPFKNFIDSYYLTIWLNSPSGKHKSSINTYGKGVSQGNLNLGLIRKFVVSIPPLKEQKSIVAKVDQLMAICDKLEAELALSQSEHEKLINTALHQLLIIK